MAEIIANLINRRPDYNIVFFAKVRRRTISHQLLNYPTPMPPHLF